jgi:hypothetical protein
MHRLQVLLLVLTPILLPILVTYARKVCFLSSCSLPPPSCISSCGYDELHLTARRSLADHPLLATLENLALRIKSCVKITDHWIQRPQLIRTR